MLQQGVDRQNPKKGQRVQKKGQKRGKFFQKRGKKRGTIKNIFNICKNCQITLYSAFFCFLNLIKHESEILPQACSQKKNRLGAGEGKSRKKKSATFFVHPTERRNFEIWYKSNVGSGADRRRDENFDDFWLKIKYKILGFFKPF